MISLRNLAFALLALVLTGCTHPFVLTPDQATLRATNPQKIPKNVAYYIAQADKDQKFVTPGGGGDKVGSYPYRDLETGLYTVLSNVFASVRPLNSPTDADTIAKNNISYVFIPVIVANSSSESVLTWPPTSFTIQLTCNIYDGKGTLLSTKKVEGNGQATFSEFHSNLSLSGERAGTDVLQKLQSALLASPELSGS